MAASLYADPSLEDILSRHGLEKKDLERQCPQGVRITIATKFVDWKTAGHYFGVPAEKLAAIDREHATENQRKIALFDCWERRKGRNANCLKLADVLHRSERTDLIEELCDEIVKLSPLTLGNVSSEEKQLQSCASQEMKDHQIGLTGISQDVTSKYCTTEEVGYNTDQSNSRSSGATGGSSAVRIDTGIQGRSSSVNDIRNPNLSPEIKEDLCQRIHKETQIMKHKFSHLQTLIRKNLNVSPEALAAHVIGMYILSEEHETRMEKASSIEQIFIILTKYWSFLDFGHLENIAEEYCCKDCDAKRELEQYKGEVQQFCRRRVSELPQGSLNNGNDIEGMDKLVVRLDLKDPSLRYVLDLKEKIANILGKPASKLVLCDISDGSVVLTFWIATSLGKELFLKKPNVFTQEQRDKLKDARVVSLEFNEVSVYKVHQKANEEAEVGSAHVVDKPRLTFPLLEQVMEISEPKPKHELEKDIVIPHHILSQVKQKYKTIKSAYKKQSPCHIDDLELVECQLYSSSSHFKGDQDRKEGENTRILIVGEAGIGKTILCASIAEDWANGQHFKKFLMVFLLPLNQRGVASAQNLQELFKNLGFNDEVCSTVAMYLMANTKKKILMIADGWDELSEPASSKESFLYRLLFGNLVPSSSLTVVVTSKSFPVIQQSISRFITCTVEGFSEETIKSYIQCKFSSNPEKIRFITTQLESNLLLRGICSVPLNLSMICSYCQSCNDPLPSTMPELYEKLAWNLAQLKLNSTKKYENLKLSNYRGLPDELKHSWSHLCQLAFEKCQADFFQVMASSFLSTELETFGLLKPAAVGSDEVMFSFLYPAFKYYLAVSHLTTLPQSEQLEVIKSMPHINPMFCRFYLSVSESPSSDIVSEVVQKLHHCCKDMCLLSFESKNEIVDREIAKSLAASGSTIMLHAQNAYECVAMVHVLEKIEQPSNVEINFQNCKLKAQQIPKLATVLGNRAKMIQVKGLDLSDNGLSDAIITHFFRRASSAFGSLEKLFLRSCDIREGGFQAIIDALANSSCKSLTQLDFSFNSLSLASLECFQQHIDKDNMQKMEILILRESLAEDLNMKFLKGFATTLSTKCQHLRRFDLTGNKLGACNDPPFNTIVSQLTASLGTNFDLQLDDDYNYMSEVEENFLTIMEESIRTKGTIDHTIAHGVIVGPGRSGKDTLLKRLTGEGPPDPNTASPSTGVLENVVKVEVKKLCAVASNKCNLKWQKLNYDEEALELMMTTAEDYSHSSDIPRPVTIKYICLKKSEEKKSPLPSEAKSDQASQGTPKADKLQEFESIQSASDDTDYLEEESKHKTVFYSRLAPVDIFKKPVTLRCMDALRSQHDTPKADRPQESESTQSASDDTDSLEEESKHIVVYRSDSAPVDIFKKAVKLRRMDALREHLESSWSLYLTNTGGQIEFQQHLPLLVCGPSIFFVAFPLHHDLDKPYEVCYEYPDGSVEKYSSPSTLMEEILQTLATIYTLDDVTVQINDEIVILKPTVFIIGTHRDCLKSETEQIAQIDRKIQRYVKQTSLYLQGSIQFASDFDNYSDRLLFTVNNLSKDDNDFQKIRFAVQQTVERRCHDFTVRCPSSWLIFSLILREKHKSNRVLRFKDCFKIAQECGISSLKELKVALSFIHSRLGLVRYFDVDKLSSLVVVDPQILFDKITHLIVETFSSANANRKEIEDFHQKGIISLAVVKRISEGSSEDSQLPLMWLINVLNHLRLAALFKDQYGEKYFFPSALCHVSKAQDLSAGSTSPNTPPKALIAFNTGFCPRGIAGALIKCLMTNEMGSKKGWYLLPHRIFRNQVSFNIGTYDITLKILPTHLEIALDPEEDCSAFVDSDESLESETELTRNLAYKEVYTQIDKCMKIVTKLYKKCEYFWTFYCTLPECKTHPHPAVIASSQPLELRCKIFHKCTRPPKGYKIWNMYKRGVNQLDVEIQESHLGKVADSMTEWEGPIADKLKLKPSDVANIKAAHPRKLNLQTREALYTWKTRNGSKATYSKLIKIFEQAGYKTYADEVRRIAHISSDTDDSSGSEEEEHPQIEQPQTYPDIKPYVLPQVPRPMILSDSTESTVVYVMVEEETLPKGDGGRVCSKEVLESQIKSLVPQLSDSKPDSKGNQDHIDKQQQSKQHQRIFSATYRDDLERELPDIILVLKDALTGTQWYNLGLQLGLPSSILDTIAAHSNHEQMMLREWLQTDPTANWEKLAAALTMIGQKALATTVRSQFVQVAARGSGSDSEPYYQIPEIPNYDVSEAEIDIDPVPYGHKLEQLQTYAEDVKLILHTVNEKEIIAVLSKMQPPDINGFEKPISFDAIPFKIILGMLGGYRVAQVNTEMGANYKKGLKEALSRLPNACAVIAVGVAYGSDRKKQKYGDVLVSKYMHGVKNIRFQLGEIVTRPNNLSTVPVAEYLASIFTKGTYTWNKKFQCNKTDSDREPRYSKVHCGSIISAPMLVADEKSRDALSRNVPGGAIGGEMEGGVLLEIQSEHNADRARRHDLGVIIIKGVGDFGDDQKQEGKKWQYTASLAAVSYTAHKLNMTGGMLFKESAERFSDP